MIFFQRQYAHPRDIFLVSRPKFTGLFLAERGEIAVHKLVFRFWISSSVPDIFAIEV